MTDRNESDRATVTPVEGVRILGAKETPTNRDTDLTAEAGTLDLEQVAREEREPQESFQRRAAVPIVGSADERSRETGDVEPSVEPPGGEHPPLPHWTEPPTGAIPAIFADDTGEHALDEDLDVWAPITGASPRFRAEGSDWADADFGDDLSDEHERLGALSEAEPVDEEAEFAEALAQRRRKMPRATRDRRGADPAFTAGATAAAAAGASTRTRPPRRPAPPEGDDPFGGSESSRDLPTAIMTAAFVAVFALISFLEGPTWTAVFAAVIIGIASIEFCSALRTKGFRAATPLVLLASATLPLAVKHYGLGAYPLYFALIVVVSMLWFLWEVTPGRPLLSVATTVLGFAYVGGLGGFAGLLLAQRNGVGLVIGVAICTIAYDVFGFFIGSQFGRTPVAPKVSPHKSVQGTVAGMVASILFGGIIAGQITPWNLHYAGWILGLLVAVGAFLGDLCESMIKRDLGLKDFGTLLPGHGGVLDRFDGLLFCLPVAYYLAIALKLV